MLTADLCFCVQPKGQKQQSQKCSPESAINCTYYGHKHTSATNMHYFQTWSQTLVLEKETILWLEILFSPSNFRIMPYFHGTNKNQFLFPWWCINMITAVTNTHIHSSNKVGGEILLTMFLFLCGHKHVSRDELINTIPINKTPVQATVALSQETSAVRV